MAPRVVLVTGVGRHVGARVAARLAADEGIERVIGVDTAQPEGAPHKRVEFVRADIRSPLIGKVIASSDVDTVVHTNVTGVPTTSGRSLTKELNVIGTMQLLAACQRTASVRSVVIRSSTAVYGSSPRNPAMFTEDMRAVTTPRGYAKDMVDVEGYGRGFARRRPDVALCILRFAHLISPRMDTSLTRYFGAPVAPTILGHDPRIQLLHLHDCIDVLHKAAVERHAGTYNVAGSGVLTLAQALRRAGRAPLPTPALLAPFAGTAAGLHLSDEQVHFLTYGRVVDTTRLREEFGFEPSFSTAAAFDDFVRGRDLTSVLGPDNLAAAERTALRAYESLRGRDG